MKRRETIITYSLMIILCIGIILGSFLGDIGEIISTIITSLTAIISAIAVYIQMRKDAKITQAEFLLEFSKVFYSYEGAQELEKKIDRAAENGELYEYTTEDYELLNDYLLWLEGLSTMVVNKTFNIKLINNLYNYRFFMVVNNPSIQKNELGRFATFYKDIFILHKLWTTYRKKHNQPILNGKYDLSKLPNYEETLKKVNK